MKKYEWKIWGVKPLIKNMWNYNAKYLLGSGYNSSTIALSGMHPYLYYVYCRIPPPPPCAVTIHKTCMDQQWNGFQNSVHIQQQRSMCWQYTKHFNLSQRAVEAIQHTISVILTMQKTNFNHKYFFSCRCLHQFRSYVHMCHVLQAQHLMSMAN